MGNRKLGRVAMSDDDDEDDAPLPLSRRNHSFTNGEKKYERKRKRVQLDDDDDEEDQEKEENPRDNKKLPKVDEEMEEESASEHEEGAEAKPVGEAVRVSGKGRGRRRHFVAFEYDGIRYELEDPVIITPEEFDQKPYVAIIKDITRKIDGSLMLLGQWFYRPEEAEKKGGGHWESTDARELFYSFHRDEVPAEAVMHKCVVHFIPQNKQIPNRKQHPGFFVQKVYDTEQKGRFNLTDKDYEDSKQEEIDVLVQKTMSRLGDLPDLEPGGAAVSQVDQLRSKRLLKKMAPLDVTREDEAPTRSGLSIEAETPGSCTSYGSEYYSVLSAAKVLTGETKRDKWLEKLLQRLHSICCPGNEAHSEGKVNGCPNGSDPLSKSGNPKPVYQDEGKDGNGGLSFLWPETAVSAACALEKVSHETFFSDFQKYNQKMRQLFNNLKGLLAQRLLKGELEPSRIVNMSSNELKEGLTAEEIASREPEVSEPMQMTDARCKMCKEKKVGVVEIIQTGHGDRYKLECTACGNERYACRDEISTLTIDQPSSVRSVGTAPLATAKFEEVEKKLVSPRQSDKSAADGVITKTTEAFVPVASHQK